QSSRAGPFISLPSITAGNRRSHDVVGHHPVMPGVSKTSKAFIATCCLDGVHRVGIDPSTPGVLLSLGSCSQRLRGMRSHWFCVSNRSRYSQLDLCARIGFTPDCELASNNCDALVHAWQTVVSGARPCT